MSARKLFNKIFPKGQSQNKFSSKNDDSTTQIDIQKLEAQKQEMQQTERIEMLKRELEDIISLKDSCDQLKIKIKNMVATTCDSLTKFINDWQTIINTLPKKEPLHFDNYNQNIKILKEFEFYFENIFQEFVTNLDHFYVRTDYSLSCKSENLLDQIYNRAIEKLNNFDVDDATKYDSMYYNICYPTINVLNIYLQLFTKLQPVVTQIIENQISQSDLEDQQIDLKYFKKSVDHLAKINTDALKFSSTMMKYYKTLKDYKTISIANNTNTMFGETASSNNAAHPECEEARAWQNSFK